MGGMFNSGLLLAGKTMVISGGTKGVGRDLALACCELGANVVIAGRDDEAAREIANRSQGLPGELLFAKVDLRNTDTCSKPFEMALDAFRSVDGFVNYAGITSAASLLETDEETFDAIMDTDFKAAFFCTKRAVECMMGRGGSIVLVSSCHSDRGEKDRAAYACSKGALETLCRHVAYHYAYEGIRCNVLVMGWSPTEGELSLRAGQGMSPEELRSVASSAIPMGRMQESSDYLPVLEYLLSDYSSMATGGFYRISGGLYL